MLLPSSFGWATFGKRLMLRGHHLWWSIAGILPLVATPEDAPGAFVGLAVVGLIRGISFRLVSMGRWAAVPVLIGTTPVSSSSRGPRLLHHFLDVREQRRRVVGNAVLDGPLHSPTMNLLPVHDVIDARGIKNL